MNMPTAMSHIRRVSSYKGVSERYTRKKKVRWTWFSAAVFSLLVAGCIHIPEESWIISHRSPLETKRQISDCTGAGLNRSIPQQAGVDPTMLPQIVGVPEVNSDGFSFVSWNIYKGKKKGWGEDFHSISRNTDILILQEAYLSGSLKEVLQQEEYQWDMAAAFKYRHIDTGVLTASRIAPNFICTFRETEPITRIPKSVLITRYPMSGTDQELLVANIHAINFTLGNTTFQNQSDRLINYLAAHQGPIIVSGDFNTWNSGRMSLVQAMAERLGLTAVRFDKNLRSKFFGHYVDHVYYRGLETKNAATPLVTSSDHNPLAVVFKLADESASGL